jgi:ABC-2 type transport system ATP-binding protein
VAEEQGAALIHARGLTKRFGTFTAVDGVDFDVQRGESFGFLGPNGAGKSSTMRMIGCVSPVSEGILQTLGMDPTVDGPKIRGRLGVVPQEDTLDVELTVRENLLIYGRYFDLPRSVVRERADRLLEFVQLDHRANERVEPLSGGLKRRLTIARALVSEPELLLLDEPTTGLDPQARANLWQHIRGLREERGTTVFLTTHYLDEADALCDRILVIDAGRIVASGTPDELKSQVGGDVLAVTVERADDAGRVAALMAELPGAEAPQVLDTRVVGRAPHGGAALVNLVRELDGAGIAVAGIESRRPSLDDVFLSLTGRSLREEGAPPTAAPATEREAALR